MALLITFQSSHVTVNTPSTFSSKKQLFQWKHPVHCINQNSVFFSKLKPLPPSHPHTYPKPQVDFKLVGMQEKGTQPSFFLSASLVFLLLLPQVSFGATQTLPQLSLKQRQVKESEGREKILFNRCRYNPVQVPSGRSRCSILTCTLLGSF